MSLTADPTSFVVNPSPTAAPSSSSSKTGVVVGVVVGIVGGLCVIVVVIVLLIYHHRHSARKNLGKRSGSSEHPPKSTNTDYRANPIFDPTYAEPNFGDNYNPQTPAARNAWEPVGVIANQTYEDPVTFENKTEVYFANPNALDAEA